MTEFKINDNLIKEINDFHSAGSALSNAVEVSGDGVATLKTGSRFVEQYRQIARLIILYERLLEKDAADIHHMADSAKELDENLSNRVYR